MQDAHKDLKFDVVMPNGNEDAFIGRALELGYKEILFLTSDPKYLKPKSDKILIKTGYLLKDISEIHRFRKNFDYLFAPAERRFFEQKIDFIIDSEMSPAKDSFHYRATHLNQVHAELAKKNCIDLVLSFSNLLYSPIQVYGRMCQNAVLISKYSLDNSSFSMARHPSMMRSRNILDALLTVLSL